MQSISHRYLLPWKSRSRAFYAGRTWLAFCSSRGWRDNIEVQWFRVYEGARWCNDRRKSSKAPNNRGGYREVRRHSLLIEYNQVTLPHNIEERPHHIHYVPACPAADPYTSLCYSTETGYPSAFLMYCRAFTYFTYGIIPYRPSNHPSSPPKHEDCQLGSQISQHIEVAWWYN